MKLEHTQGPWRVLPEEAGVPYIRIRGTVLGRRYKIANVHMETHGSLGEAWNEQARMESRANARLIAAATELLNELEWLRAYIGRFDPPGCPNFIVKRIDVVLAKATGSTP